jgi:hypothetical protein
MKAVCPVCGVIGSVQQRGKSVRIGHYVGYKDGTLIIQWHSVGKDFIIKNGKELVKNNDESKVIRSWGWELNPKFFLSPRDYTKRKSEA